MHFPGSMPAIWTLSSWSRTSPMPPPYWMRSWEVRAFFTCHGHRENMDVHIVEAGKPVRELAGVLSAHRLFADGMIVTNTSFTPDARDFASRTQSLIRRRGFQDLMRWVADNFADDAEWREMPSRVQLCEGLLIDLR